MWWVVKASSSRMLNGIDARHRIKSLAITVPNQVSAHSLKLWNMAVIDDAREQRFSLPAQEIAEKLSNKRSFEDHSSQVVDILLILKKLLEACPKVSHIQGNLAEFLKSLSFPVEPEYLHEKNFLYKRGYFVPELEMLLRSTVREYPDDVKEVASASPSPEEGKYFDVLELLSRFPGDLIRNDGDRLRVALNPDTFKGKYVLICCFNVPVFPIFKSYLPYTVNLCNELYSTRDDFEMLIVARMNNVANSEEFFNHFLSGFPKSCLVVPFEDNQRIDYICKVFGHHNYYVLTSLLLNGEGIAEGIVLPHQSLSPVYASYGADGFPFTDNILSKKESELRDMIFDKEGNWLERVLRCSDSSPDFVYRFNPSGGHREKMPISEFSKKRKNKHVGIFLCSTGGFIPRLLKMYLKCREDYYAKFKLYNSNGELNDFEVELDFEVVVVFMPFHTITDPRLLQEEIESLLKKHNVCGWWCLPFNNSVSVRFVNLTQFYEVPWNTHDCKNDKLFMVGPDVDHLDIYGLHVMRRQGVDAFPFTVDAGIKYVEGELKQFSLESLFPDDDVLVCRGNDSSDSTQLGQLLKGKKNIIICVCGYANFEALASMYHETKAVEKEGFELLFVASSFIEELCGELPYHKMPWYICPENGINSTNLIELLDCIELESDACVGFGEDGHVYFCRRISDVIYDAKHRPEHRHRFPLVNSLYRDIEYLLGYDEYRDHDMEWHRC